MKSSIKKSRMKRRSFFFVYSMKLFNAAHAWGYPVSGVYTNTSVVGDDKRKRKRKRQTTPQSHLLAPWESLELGWSAYKRCVRPSVTPREAFDPNMPIRCRCLQLVGGLSRSLSSKDFFSFSDQGRRSFEGRTKKIPATQFLFACVLISPHAFLLFIVHSWIRGEREGRSKEKKKFFCCCRTVSHLNINIWFRELKILRSCEKFKVKVETNAHSGKVSAFVTLDEHSASHVDHNVSAMGKIFPVDYWHRRVWIAADNCYESKRSCAEFASMLYRGRPFPKLHPTSKMRVWRGQWKMK